MAKENLSQSGIAVLNSDLSRLEEELRLLSHCDLYGDHNRSGRSKEAYSSPD